MRNRIFLAALIGGFTLLTVAETAHAQRRRGGGRASIYVDTPYFSAGYGRPGRYSSNRYWDGGRYYGRYYGGWYDGYYGPGYGYNVNPGYTVVEPDYAVNSGTRTYESFYTGPSTRAGRIRVIVPDPQADVWVGDKETQQKGTQRVFATKELDGTYIYKVKATWQENGQEMTSEKKVEVSPGQEAVVAFGGRDDSERRNVERLRNRPNEEAAEPQADDRDPSSAKAERRASSMSGKVVRVGDGELVMSDIDGSKQHTHRLAADAKVLIKGREAKAEDLKPGDEIEVTMQEGDSHTAAKIEVTSNATKGAREGAKDEPKDQADALPE